MSKHLPVPQDLQHLIEKRDEEGDRRAKAGSHGSRPSGQERRKTDRRRKRQRKSDS